MKKFPLMLLTTILFVACSKNNDIQPGNPADISDKVKKTTYNSGATTYNYDASGRIQSTNELSGAKTVYEYQAGKVLEKQYDAAGVLTVTYTYDLNSNGLVEKETRSNQAGFQEIRLYNSDRQTIKFSTLQNGSSSSGDFFYSNGNCDSVRFSTNGNWQSTVKMTYYDGKPNTLDYAQFGEDYWGKRSKNLMKSEQYFYTDGSGGNLESYSYEFDTKGRITKMISVAGSNINISYFNY